MHPAGVRGAKLIRRELDSHPPPQRSPIRIMPDPFFPPCTRAPVKRAPAALKELNIDYVIPLHYTGEPFYDKARAEMPGKVLRSYTGTRLVLS